MRPITEKIIDFNKKRDWDKFHTPENLAKSISIEAAELLECYQWSSSQRGIPTDEIADILIYCYSMCSVFGVDPEYIMFEKIKQNEKKYPVKKCKGKSTKYSIL